MISPNSSIRQAPYDPTAPAAPRQLQRLYNEAAVSPVISNPRTSPNSVHEWDATASPVQRSTQYMVSPLIGFRSPQLNAKRESAVSPIIGSTSSSHRQDVQAESSRRDQHHGDRDLEQVEARERFYREQYEREKRERAEREIDRLRPDLDREHDRDRDRDRPREQTDQRSRFESRVNAHQQAALQQVQQAQQLSHSQSLRSVIRPQEVLYIPQNAQYTLSPLTPTSMEAPSRASHSTYAPVAVSPADPYPSTSDVSRDTSMQGNSDVIQSSIVRSRSLHTPTTRHNPHVPPHIAAMQDQYHNPNAYPVGSSLFPADRRYSMQPVGLRQGHKVTGWHPPGPSNGRPSMQGKRPSSAPPGPNRKSMSGKGKKKKWFTGSKTPTKKYFDDGTWMMEESRKCIVM